VYRKRTAGHSKPASANHTPSVAKNEEGISDTCKNQRIRQQLHANWRKADALRRYWSASFEMRGAISGVQRHNLPEGDLYPERRPDDHWAILAKYRAAIMAQLLTPASTVAEITWKRAAFKAGQHRHTDVKPERIERAIADDVEFLLAPDAPRRSLFSEAGSRAMSADIITFPGAGLPDTRKRNRQRLVAHAKRLRR
jgi:hypothetical protein